MRALLVVNPAATTTSRRGQQVLVRALGSDLKLDVEETGRRGHAAELARRAVDDEVDLVVVLGGDGTVNEVVNGLLARQPAGPGAPAELADRPALAVVPGGSTNVFARSLGLPRDPMDATAEILDALREGRRRRVGLGRADERWFTFCAGLGLDAEVVRRIEAVRRDGQRSSAGLYVRTALRRFFFGTDRRHPALRLECPGAEPIRGIFLAIVSNTTPWTYLGARPVVPSPDASLSSALDVLALRRLRTVSTLRVVGGMLLSPRGPRPGRSVVALHDVPAFTLRADRPVAVQIDGDYVGERSAVRFVAVPDALTVVC